MSKINVHLRIAGLYLNTTVAVSTTPAKGFTKLRVKDVLDAYIAVHPITTPGGLAYDIKTGSAPPGTPGTPSSILSFTHNFPGRYDFDGNGSTTDPVDGPTLSGAVRGAGLYKLQEFFIPGVQGVVAWQCYVEDATGFRVSKTPAGRGFVFFDQDPFYTIGDKYTITWRMVAILLAPSIQGKAPKAARDAALAGNLKFN